MRLSKRSRIFTCLILSLGCAADSLPHLLTLATIVKSTSESSVSFFTLPKSLYLGSYLSVLQDQKLYHAYGNILLITTVSLVCKLMNWLNLLSPLGVTLLYMAHAACESTFLYVGYLATVSTTIEEAAYIDGASTFQIYSRVILPLMTPILSIVVIREGLAVRNGFQLPLITMNRSSRLWTLTICLYNFSSEYSVDDSSAFACLVLTCLPIVILYIIMQKQIIGGLTSGAIKG